LNGILEYYRKFGPWKSLRLAFASLQPKILYTFVVGMYYKNRLKMVYVLLLARG